MSQVGPNSIAARDGRIREGDRILQINGHDVQDKEEAVALLSNEECKSIVLLVTRPEMQMEESWLDEEHSEFLEELKMEILQEQRNEENQQLDARVHQDQEGVAVGSPSKQREQRIRAEQHDHNRESETPHTSSPQRRLRESFGLAEHRLSVSLGRDIESGPGSGLASLGLSSGRSGVGGSVQRVERDLFQQHLLELKCQIRNRGECGLYYARSSTIECSGGGGVGVERELRMLNEELRSIELECQSIMQAHQLRKTQSDDLDLDYARPTSPASANVQQRAAKAARGQQQQQQQKGRGGRLADIHEYPERWDTGVGGGNNNNKQRDNRDNSSSAYNTAESARSTPLGLIEHSRSHSPESSQQQRRVNLTNLKNLHGSAHSSPTHTLAHTHTSSPRHQYHQHTHTHTRSHTLPTPSSQSARTHQTASTPGSPNRTLPAPSNATANSSSLDQSPSNPSESDPALPADDERVDRKRGHHHPHQRRQPAWHASPYHHHATTATTTAGSANAASARNYQSYVQLLQQHSSSSLEFSQSQLSLLSLRPGRPGEPRLEWKVKVRADGTRYVARRPARDRILRERALRIREERSGGMTTDDDAASELKMGRYWSKEERKQQLARAREQRRRREFMQRSRLECLKETTGGATGTRREVNILELSQRKMMKRRNKKILDNWMTIQELMTHGARVPEGTKVHNAFLSVTTV
ncbi:PDZ domain-containing RING finger protein 4 [Sardina pilchardus]|uniref:PDZ domain-containing RING finger protein 4 n=1 Tax=Sardina pilchardus TaxID=27697 RepID=UPI002E0F9913